jgi:hypothetical protein
MTATGPNMQPMAQLANFLTSVSILGGEGQGEPMTEEWARDDGSREHLGLVEA